MAPSQQYDEGGDMASYFVVTLLALVLVPLSIIQSVKLLGSFKKHPVEYCSCVACQSQRENIRKRNTGSLLKPKFSNSTIILIVGWCLFAVLARSTAGIDNKNKIYNPFEILGLASDSTLAEIKSHYKKLSRVFHPDKFKGNLTMEEVEMKFIELTKAYKSLTDETIRKNLAEWGNPDGRQPVELALAIPKYLVEGKNTIWVLLAYGVVFGLMLPIFVGRWWFGSREKTKDGVNARTAAAYFKSLKEDSSLNDVIAALGKSYTWELTSVNTHPEIDDLDKQISALAGSDWSYISKECDLSHESGRRFGMVLLYAHLLRLPIKDTGLIKKQREIILQTPVLLNSLLNVTTTRSWLTPTLSIMRLCSFITQALKPTVDSEQVKMAQLPGIHGTEDRSEKRLGARESVEDRLVSLQTKADVRSEDIKTAMESWGRLECVDVFFKVIGEKIVTPASIVYLIVKLRIRSPLDLSAYTPQDRSTSKATEERDDKFLASSGDAEDRTTNLVKKYAHAPYWPGFRLPNWWIVIADDKTNRVVVPPIKISDIPYSTGESQEDYRSYKLQFQAPPNVGLFTWRVQVVSDTFVGEDLVKDIILKIEEPADVDSETAEDEISDPEEDSLAGQMASMRGGSVKRSPLHAAEDESDYESGTDDDEEDDSSSDSDSD